MRIRPAAAIARMIGAAPPLGCTLLLLPAALCAWSPRTLAQEAGEAQAASAPAAVAEFGEGSLEGPIDPARYRLGPGDLLHIRIGGRTAVDRRIEVSPEGYLILPEGPCVPLAGVPLLQAQAMVGEALRPYYRDSTVQLHLLKLRTFGVYVVGHVTKVGMQRSTAVGRASEVIARAEGVTEQGSKRAIRVTHADGTSEPVDLGLFLETGDLAHNPSVEAGDRIYVPPRGNTAQVSGAVMKPGEVEVIPGDSVATLLQLAHGLREDAYPDSAYLESYGGSSTQSTRRWLDLRKAADRTLPVRERDLLFVRRKPIWRTTRAVLVDGEVRSPGAHALPADSLHLTEVIAMAGGFTDLASLREAYVIRPLGDRPPDPEFERLKALPSTEMTEDEHEYYLMKLRSQKQAMSVDFEMLFANRDRSQNIFIRPGDEIYVPPLRSYVTLVGEVTRPGNVPFRLGMTGEQYIEHAGGLTTRAAKGKVAVIRALTGEWVDDWEDAELGPGDTVWIPRKPRRDWGAYALRALTIVSQVATAYIVIDAAVGN